MTMTKYYHLPEILKDIKTKFSQELGVSFIHKYDIFMTPCVIIKYYIGCDYYVRNYTIQFSGVTVIQSVRIH